MTIVRASVLAIVVVLATGCASEADDASIAESATATEESDRPTTTRDRPTATDAPTTTTVPEPPTLPMGETLSFTTTELGGDNETFIDVTMANPATFTESPMQYGPEPQNGMYLVVDVTVVVAANSAGTYSAGPHGFKFVAADGTVAESSFAAGIDPQLSFVDLSAGQQVSGKVVFDINPAHQIGGRVQIDDVGANYNQPFAYWGPL